MRRVIYPLFFFFFIYSVTSVDIDFRMDNPLSNVTLVAYGDIPASTFGAEIESLSTYVELDYNALDSVQVSYDNVWGDTLNSGSYFIKKLGDQDSDLAFRNLELDSGGTKFKIYFDFILNQTYFLDPESNFTIFYNILDAGATQTIHEAYLMLNNETTGYFSKDITAQACNNCQRSYNITGSGYFNRIIYVWADWVAVGTSDFSIVFWNITNTSTISDNELPECELVYDSLNICKPYNINAIDFNYSISCTDAENDLIYYSVDAVSSTSYNILLEETFSNGENPAFDVCGTLIYSEYGCINDSYSNWLFNLRSNLLNNQIGFVEIQDDWFLSPNLGTNFSVGWDSMENGSISFILGFTDADSNITIHFVEQFGKYYIDNLTFYHDGTNLTIVDDSTVVYNNAWGLYNNLFDSIVVNLQLGYYTDSASLLGVYNWFGTPIYTELVNYDTNSLRYLVIDSKDPDTSEKEYFLFDDYRVNGINIMNKPSFSTSYNGTSRIHWTQPYVKLCYTDDVHLQYSYLCDNYLLNLDEIFCHAIEGDYSSDITRDSRQFLEDFNIRETWISIMPYLWIVCFIICIIIGLTKASLFLPSFITLIGGILAQDPNTVLTSIVIGVIGFIFVVR